MSLADDRRLLECGMPADRTAIMKRAFGADRALIGMLHLGALPGTPAARAPLGDVITRALGEAHAYAQAGFTALMIENMHDRPFLKRAVGPEIVAAMTAVSVEVRRASGLPLGVQALAGANRESLAVALACGATFVRVEGYVFAHVADEGLIEADAGELLRYRRVIGAEGVAVFADVKKKHAAHAITGDMDVVDTALAAEFSLADGVILSGDATGREADPEEVTHVSGAVSIPVLVGSGLTPDNLAMFAAADGFIVGSSVKRGGLWSNELDPAAVAAMAKAFRSLGPRA
ncbi:MAG TPA: BtpA/SgcQ family protein [Candidatus Sulfotelmatobacter sp.]|nr:BtpA/SgcQ family protein [Candidatus Sulfotelmatobacter sp.]